MIFVTPGIRAAGQLDSGLTEYTDTREELCAIKTMQTHRLRTLVDPRQARLLLDSYIAKAGALPDSACQQTDTARLPLALQEGAEQAESQGSVWSAWTHGSNAWLFVGQLNLNRARERGQPVLEIEVYDYERRTKGRKIALRTPDGSWQILKD